MKMVLFDLGKTLESQGVLLPGATEMLESVQSMHDADGTSLKFGLVSDFALAETPAQVPVIRAQYVAVLDALGIRHFFEPVETKVTLSTDVGVFKPNAAIFRAAIDKLASNQPFENALFVTENRDHIAAARELGLRAVHFKGPGQITGDVTQLTDLIPIISAFVNPEPR